MIKVSIIVPVYNVEKFILRCLDSISKQSYDGPLECIIVDDLSPDNSESICRKFINNYKGFIDFVYYKREKNGGLSVARNTGMSIATGDYVYFLDSDDELPKDAISLLVDEVRLHPDVDVVMGTMFSNPAIEYYSLDEYRSFQYITDISWLQYHFFKAGKTIPVNACNKLVRMEILRNNSIEFKPGIIHEDNHWLFLLLKYVKSFAFVFEPTYIRYFNEGSIMTSRTSEKEAHNWYVIICDFCNNLYPPFNKLQLARYIYIYAYNSIYLYEDCKQLYSKFISLALLYRMYGLYVFLNVYRILLNFKIYYGFTYLSRFYYVCLSRIYTRKNMV